MSPLESLVAANLLFVGGHLLMSHPLRAPMVGALGERGFLGVYSLVSVALLAWVGHLFPQAQSIWMAWPSGDALWIVASVLTIFALALLLGSLRGNPALPQTDALAAANARARGVYAVTRHPMMWAFALWAMAHILVWPSPRTLVTAGAMGVLALLGAHLQDGKKRALMGDAWAAWEAKTSYWPRLSSFARIGWGLWLAALALWLAATWLHMWMAGIPAGIFRWTG
ncbi:MAG: MFS transporter [Alphaproteobacteria bacterium]|nr:MFS transporter [Alphaproteobacteria bacterium]